MMLTPKYLWQIVYRRLLLIDAERPVAQSATAELLAALPLRLPDESYLAWLKRGQKLAQVIPFPRLNFRYITDVQRLAADTRASNDALPDKALLSTNKQFRLTIAELPDQKLKLTVEALGNASSRYAGQLIGIAADASKDSLISLIQLDELGEGFDASLENSPALRLALLRPVLALIGPEQDA